jgi:SPP1 family predicted phage head-tail adaptor
MDSGALRHSVILENPGPSIPDGDGGFTQSWAPNLPSPVWASITPATSRDLERLVAASVQSVATHVIRIRYHANVTTATRVTYGARVFEVTGVQNPDERNIELVLVCQERVL